VNYLTTNENVSEELLKLLLNKNFMQIDKDYNDTNIIYHYTSISGLLGIINPYRNPSLYFTQYDCLNDKSEREEFFDFLKKYCDSKLKQNIISKDFYNKVNELIKNQNTFDFDYITLNNNNKKGCSYLSLIECDTYLCCFSIEQDLLPMWNYYTKSQHYEGVSIGIYTHQFHNINCFNKGYTISLKKVLYDDEEKIKKLDSTILELSKYYDNANQNTIKSIEAFIIRIIREFQFSFKHKSFEHEKEVRAILRIPRDNKINKDITESKYFTVKYRDNNGYITPYTEFDFPKNSIREITTSPLLDNDMAVKNLKKMLKSYGYNHVNINSSEIPIRF